MRALTFDKRLRFVMDRPVPEPLPGWALIRVQLAGICKTDLEIMKGYMGFQGILGHEFVGTVEACDDSAWAGKRVAGEINAACGECELCRNGLGRHCPVRSVLGIQGLDGCMADYCILPSENLIKIPETMSDDMAVFIEPLSAACEILEQIHVTGNERAIVLGDGRIGILCAWVLSTALSNVTLVGKHADKLDLARWNSLKTHLHSEQIEPGVDIVVDATGSANGLAEAIAMCRPRGTIILKTTIASQVQIDFAPVVINELTVIGSRCGKFIDGINLLKSYPDIPLEKLISARYPIEQAITAVARAQQKDSIKVLIDL